MLKKVFIGCCVIASVANASVAIAQDDNKDTFESFNRVSFQINDTLDTYLLRPIAVGYRHITNQYVRDRVNQVLYNIKEPVYAVNNLLQGDFKDSLTNLGRFGVNSTVGLLGMYDVAGGGMDLNPNTTSFDETLSNWCVADGPFLVLPILGPTTPRALAGDTVDGFINPVFVASYNDANVRDKANYSYAFISAIAKREAALDIIDDFKKNSVDFYATARSAYLQSRGKIKRCAVNETNDTNTAPEYDFDFDIDE